MTNEQKAEVIAVWDGSKTALFTELYLTDLNYLVPVAMLLAKLLQYDDMAIDLGDAILNLTKTPEGTYQQLFDVVYEAIVYFENQNQ